MKYLLDTHTLIWWLNDDKRLSATASELIQHPETDIHISAVSAWEIATKLQKGKLPMAVNVLPDFSAMVEENGFIDLPITSAHMVRSALIESEHKDPFDRILAAQSILEGMALISVDEKMPSLGIMTRW